MGGETANCTLVIPGGNISAEPQKCLPLQSERGSSGLASAGEPTAREYGGVGLFVVHGAQGRNRSVVQAKGG